MTKTIEETSSEQPVGVPASDELSDRELEKASGGVPNSGNNIMKTKHDTVKNTISNIH